LKVLLPDDLITRSSSTPARMSPSFIFLIIRNQICGTFRRIWNSDDVLLHVSLSELRQVFKNCYVRSCFEDHVWFEDRWMVASLCDE
jgi:hypothetical protein